MMAVHKRCTEQARNATGQTCGLNDDFRELNSIMDKRLIEFADCVSSVDTFEVEDDEEIPEAACRQISFQPLVEQITCWRTVASVRAKCLQLQRCCPSAKSCKKQGQHSEYTQALRAKHIEINRRTLECREQMQQLVDMKQESPKAHGAVSSTYEKPIDVSNSYKHQSNQYAMEDHEQAQPESVKRLAEAIAKVLIKRQQVQQQQQSSKDVLTVFSKKDSTSDGLKEFGEPSLKPTQFDSQQTPLVVFDRNARTKGPMQKNNIMKFLKKPPFDKQGIFSTNPNANGHIPFLIAAKQPQSFAIPSKVNLRRMRIYEARPELKKVISRDWGRGVGMLGKFPTSITTNESRVNYFTPRSVNGAGRLFDLQAVAHGIRTFSEDTSIRPLKKVEAINRPPKSYFSEQRIWSVDSNTNTSITTASTTPSSSVEQVQQQDSKDVLTVFSREDSISDGMKADMEQEVHESVSSHPDMEQEKHEYIQPSITTTIATTPIPAPTTSIKLQIKPSKVIDFETGYGDLIEYLTTTSAPIPVTENVIATESIRTTEAESTMTKGQYIRSIVSGVVGKPKSASFQFLKKIHITPIPPISFNNTTTRIPAYGGDKKISTSPAQSSVPCSDSRCAHVLYGVGQRTTTEAYKTSSFEEGDSELKSFVQDPHIDNSIDTSNKQTRLQSQNAFISSSDSEERESQLAREELIKNLEEFIKKRGKPLHGKVNMDFEAERVEILRKTRQDYEKENQVTGYCELYSTCTDELRYVQKECEAANGRLMPGLPRRRFGDCHAKLVQEYENLDAIKTKVESSFDNCLLEEIIERKAEEVETCPRDWPTLPSFEYQPKCAQKLLIIKNHCSKLARCCKIVPRCRRQIEELQVTKEYAIKSQILARKSAMCQIRAYNDYYQRYMLRAAARQQARVNLSKFQRIAGFSSNFPDANQLDTKKEYPDSGFRLL